MFNGTENFNDDYFVPLEKVGATDMNGTTNSDRTNYFQNVPTAALDLALWMESDRMGHLLGAIDIAKLDEQRGVVQNEKRQGENQPYGITRQLLTENTYPKGHPYSWTTIGSMDDLNAASLEDVQTWFKTYYGAANAVLSVAGDVDAQDVKQRVEKYFGDIPSGPPVAHYQTWVAKRHGTQRQRVEDRVPQARIYKVWNIPEWGSQTAQNLDLVSDLLASGKNSRLYKRLVYEDQIATSVSAYVYLREIGGQFMIVGTARAGVDLAEVERAIDEELAAFIEKGPDKKELERVKTEYMARFIRGIERIGGFGGTSDVLAMSQTYGGSPDTYKAMHQYVRQATPDVLQEAARDWLTDGEYILEVHPFPAYTAIPVGADRSALPELGAQTPAAFPTVQRATLSNGLKVVLAERHAVPLVSMDLLVDAGYAADHLATPGTASLTLNMMDEGTATRGALEISEELSMLGATLSTFSTLDTSNVSLSALTGNLEPSLEIFWDVALHPAFSEAEFKRLQQQQLASIRQEKASPRSAGMRVIPAVVFGADHPYGTPYSGTGLERTVADLTPKDLAAFHATWFKPNNATLLVVGDITLNEITRLLESRMKGWKAGDVPSLEIPAVDLPPRSEVYLIDRPGAQQSYIFTAQPAPALDPSDEVSVETMNRILGGSFTSRINMNLREDKHWSYGARSSILPNRAQRLYLGRAPVQTDKTRESLIEIRKELSGILGDRPITRDELDKSQKNQTLRLAGQWETMNAVKNSLRRLVVHRLPDTYYNTYPEEIAALTVPELESAAEKMVHPDRLVWLVVGDRSKIEDGIRELNLGTVHVIDADGNPVR
jgi:zinc protease